MGGILTRWFVLFVAVLAGSASAGQVGQQRELAEGSDVIIAGRVTGVWWIFDEEKAKQREAAEKPTRLPDGTYSAPMRIWDQNVVIGRGYRVVVAEVIKGGEKVKIGQTMTVFMPGKLIFGNQAVLMEKGKYLLLLRHVRATEQLERARINSTMIVQGGRPIDFDTLYSVTGDRQGAIEITGDEKKVIDQFKTKIRE